MTYSIPQWLLLFFAYCFLGWVWESCYVSVKQREWINRGFLYGPWLPIYGFGAIVILLSTLRVQESILLVYIAGMFGATALELVTGFLMEKLFHMRYWDYSHLPLNLNGYICFWVSLAWGGFSVLLVKFIHPVVSRAVLWITGDWAYLVSLVLTMLFAVDVTKSVQAVLNTKQLLKKLTQTDNTISRIKSRLEEGSEYVRQLKEHLDLALMRAREKVLLQGTESLAERRSRKSRTISSMLGKTEQYLEEVAQRLGQTSTDIERARLLNARQSLQELHDLLAKAEAQLQERKNSDFRQAVSILRRNPTAVSHKYPKAFSEIASLKEQFRKKRKEK